MMQWISFGWGFVVGAFAFDLAWRVLYHKTGQLLDRQRELITQLESPTNRENQHGV